MKNLARPAILILLLTTAPLLEAQTAAAHIEGTVVDPSGALLPGAHLRFLPEKGPPVAVTADAAAAFHADLPAGHYRLSAVEPGYQEQEQPLDLSAAAPTRLTVTLKIEGNVETVTVTAAAGYAATIESTAGRVPMRVLDTPQTVYTVTHQQLEDRGALSIKDALSGVPAVQASLGEGRRDSFLIRGFSSQNDQYIDGVRDDAPYFRDLSNTGSLDVVEGPAAVLYGRGSSGGLVNRVTKRPDMEGLSGSVSVTGGSYGEKRIEADAGESWLHNTLGARLTGAGEDAHSYRHFVSMNRYAFAPTLRWQPSGHTDLYLQVERLRDERLPDRGVAADAGPYGPVPISNFYGYAHDFIHEAVTDATFDVRHEFDDGWHVHDVARHAGYLVDWSTLYLNQLTTPTGSIFGSSVARPRALIAQLRELSSRAVSLGSTPDPVLTRGQYNAHQVQANYFNQAEAYRSGHFAGLDHLFLVGAEYGHQTVTHLQYTGTAPPTTLYNPAPDLAPTYATTPAIDNLFLAQTAAVYAQDLVQLAAKWKLLAGMRFDNYRQGLDQRLPHSPNLSRADNDFSPRAGLLYQPTEQSTLYASYSRNFDPSGEGLNLAANAADLAPEKTTNYEVGGKLAGLPPLFGADGRLADKLISTVAVYRLDRTHIKTTNPANPAQLIEVGEQRTDGASLSFQGSLTARWMIVGGYAWQDAKITSSDSSFNGVLYQGKRPMDVPRHSGSLWTTYRFASGFGVGGGYVFATDSFAANDNLVQLPGSTRLDAMAFYHRGHTEVDAHLANLANTRYYDSSHSDLELFPGAPISGLVTARYRF